VGVDRTISNDRKDENEGNIENSFSSEEWFLSRVK
jgi:hypothetical protein